MPIPLAEPESSVFRPRLDFKVHQIDLNYSDEYVPSYWQAKNPGAKWTPDHGIDEFIKHTFTAGECGTLALVLHQLTKWPLFLDADRVSKNGQVAPGDIGHVWVCSPEGKAVDILGVHPSNYANTAYTLKPGIVMPVKSAQLHKIFNRPHYLAWARKIVEYFPNHFGVSHYFKTNASR